MTRLRTFLLVLLCALPLPVLAETALWMGEEDGCFWCERWDDEISHIYPKTAEGKTAPLRRFDVHAAPPKDVKLLKRVHFTPTFVLVQDGMEVGRIEGYPGQDFFWGLLNMLFQSAQIKLETG